MYLVRVNSIEQISEKEIPVTNRNKVLVKSKSTDIRKMLKLIFNHSHTIQKVKETLAHFPLKELFYSDSKAMSPYT